MQFRILTMISLTSVFLLLINCSKKDSEALGSCVYKFGNAYKCVPNKTKSDCEKNYVSADGYIARWYENQPCDVTIGIIDPKIDHAIKTRNGEIIPLKFNMLKEDVLLILENMQTQVQQVNTDNWLIDDNVLVFSKNRLVSASSQSLKSNIYYHNFAAVQTNTINEYKYNLINTSSEPITILEVHPSCDCTRVKSNFKTILNPNETTDIEIVFDSKGLIGPTSRFIKIITNNSQHPEMVLFFNADVQF